MRRTILLLTGFGAGFCVIWILLLHSQAVLDGTWISAPEIPEKTALSIPFSIPQTGLMAEQLVVYEGPFWEDGSGREVSNTAALLLRNSTQQGIEHTRVVLMIDGGQLIFEADTIPAGETVLVPEKNGAVYTNEPILDSIGWVANSQEDWSRTDKLQIRYTGMGTVAVTNRSDSALQEIRLYYKNHIADPGILVGGRSNVYVIARLEPDQTIHICPKNYAKGYSKFVRVAFEMQPDI